MVREGGNESLSLLIFSTHLFIIHGRMKERRGTMEVRGRTGTGRYKGQEWRRILRENLRKWRKRDGREERE